MENYKTLLQRIESLEERVQKQGIAIYQIRMEADPATFVSLASADRAISKDGDAGGPAQGGH